LDKDAAPHLRKGTQFWVVRPRIGAGGVSGLSTIVAGAYISIMPGPGAATRTFTGLEEPPVLDAEVPGHKFILQTSALGSLHIGAPVYFRRIKVGQVIGHELAEDSQHVNIHAFVEEPHHIIVRKDTKFWNASGIDVSVSAEGLNVRTESFEALLSGGIAFETPANSTAAPGQDGDVFRLYNTYASIADDDTMFTEKLPYVLHFDGSLGGLSVGAPVKFRGLKVGSVTNIHMEFDPSETDIRIPVEIVIEPQRVQMVGGDGGETADDDRQVIAELVERGLRARLQVGSLLTGQMFVELELHPGTEVRLVGDHSEIPELPTLPSFTNSISKVLEDVQNLPLAELFDRAVHTMEGLDRLVNSTELLDTVSSANTTLKEFQKLSRVLSGQVGTLGSSLQNTAKATHSTMVQAQKALTGVAGVTAPDSPIVYDLTTSLEELAGAARSIRVLANYLERHPDALVFGKAKARAR
ncbi:MAG: MlaD family protein, partial [Candidatus Tectomicrobia bacterium]|nr:MlaD family protein [Candidatus Tectomicrobia bacterium]